MNVSKGECHEKNVFPKGGTLKKSVLIAGGGIAGLAAAERLSGRFDVTLLEARGRLGGRFDVTLLEARGRLGGRIWTDRSWNCPIDLGAQVIHGFKKNPIAAIAEKLRIETRAADYFSFYLYDGRSTAGDGRTAQNVSKFRGIIDSISENVRSRSLSAAQIIDTQAKARGIDPQILDWLKTSEAIYSGADLKDQAAKYYQQGNEYEGSNVMFPGGYDRILKSFRLKNVRVYLGCVITKIRWGKTGVRMVTGCGDFEADFALMTLPLGVLRAGSVKFEPALPKWKQAAVRRLGMGTLDMVFLEFPRIFWPQDRDFIGVLGQKGEFARFVSRSRMQKTPVLVGLLGGDAACRFERLTDREIETRAMKALKKCFGAPIPAPVRTKITRWHSDPFSFGSYSFIPCGASPEDYEILAKPCGNLRFAGEATNREHPGTVHGAYLSGLREAERLMKARGK